MPRHGFSILGLVLAAGCSLDAAGPRMVVRAPDAEHPTGRVELRGVDATPESLRVRVAAAPREAPDVLGEAHADGAVLVFTPRFPLEHGLTYGVSSGEDATLDLEFSLPAMRLEPLVEVTAVYPDGPELPANLLKIYLHFSGPMRRGEAYRRARLLDGSDARVEGAFLEIDPELWNPERTRLTLLIDPGRIKRGLVPHEELGPVLHPDRDYTLTVDSDWRDDRGAPLRAGFRHSFRTGAADATSPAPERWRESNSIPRRPQLSATGSSAHLPGLSAHLSPVLSRSGTIARMAPIRNPPSSKTLTGHADICKYIYIMSRRAPRAAALSLLRIATGS